MDEQKTLENLKTIKTKRNTTLLTMQNLTKSIRYIYTFINEVFSFVIAVNAFIDKNQPINC